MRTTTVLVALAGTIALAAAQAPKVSLVIVGGRIYTSPAATPIDNGVIVVDQGRIAAFGPRDTVEIPPAERTIDATGFVVTAGFQNNHVHFTQGRWMGAGAQAAPQLNMQFEELFTRYGFTTVVDTASDISNTLSLRRRIVAGQVKGPRILTAGAALYPPGGVPYYVRNEMPPALVKQLPQPGTPEDVARLIQRHSMFGTVVVKLFTGSWVERGKVVTMLDEIAAVAVEEGHKNGMIAFAHVSNIAGLEVALRARVDVLAHAVEDTRGMTDDHRKRLLDGRVAIIPTFKLFARNEDVKDILAEVKSHARGGGQILFGTDVGYVRDPNPAEEYELMAAAGFSWSDILTSLTTAPADRFGEQAERGRVEKGFAADLVVLGTDPAQGARAFTDVRYTIRDGTVVYSRPASQ